MLPEQIVLQNAPLTLGDVVEKVLPERPKELAYDENACELTLPCNCTCVIGLAAAKFTSIFADESRAVPDV
jgi:hypothetical protein